MGVSHVDSKDNTQSAIGVASSDRQEIPLAAFKAKTKIVPASRDKEATPILICDLLIVKILGEQTAKGRASRDKEATPILMC